MAHVDREKENAIRDEKIKAYLAETPGPVTIVVRPALAAAINGLEDIPPGEVPEWVIARIFHLALMWIADGETGANTHHPMSVAVVKEIYAEETKRRYPDGVH